MERVPRQEDVRRDQRVGLSPRELDDLEDGREDRGLFSLGEGGTRSLEVACDDLEPEPDEGAVGLLLCLEVREREAEDEGEEGVRGRDGGKGREEGDEVGEREGSEGRSGGDEGRERGREEVGLGDEREGGGEVGGGVVGKEEGDESRDVEVVDPADADCQLRPAPTPSALGLT